MGIWSRQWSGESLSLRSSSVVLTDLHRLPASHYQPSPTPLLAFSASRLTVRPSWAPGPWSERGAAGPGLGQGWARTGAIVWEVL